MALKRYSLLILSLALSSVISAPVDGNSNLKSWFCKDHREDVFPVFSLMMRIKRTANSPPTGMCMLDIESTSAEVEYEDEVTSELTTSTLQDSTASFEASGINGTITVTGDILVPINFISVGFNPSSEYVYVNASSWDPWLFTSLSNLAESNNKGLEQLLAEEIVAINLGCDHQVFPTPSPVTPLPLTTAAAAAPAPALPAVESSEDDDSTPSPLDLTSNRKNKPDDMDFSLLVDPRCIEDVQVHIEIKDACIEHKEETPLKIVGMHGSNVEENMQKMDSSNRLCTMLAELPGDSQ
ncbi:putative chemokine-binding protein-like protein [Seal parapoxvirus]|uniref:Putative chemokine-binding protein-like protein n=1 Tax=Seal parapoxvirus TaxID=187984 RepID=A0A1Z4CGD7_9POXV|nr:putative chemokine-binding protein-like protein [Seal parapoxvirus]ASF89977.1 putative chemokine-binding protein-like protein [Seal parapoxvirus]